MDITSYLLGKKKGGFDWSEIGYDEPPNTINESINYSKSVKSYLDSKSNFDNACGEDKSLVFAPASNNTSYGNTFYRMFRNCTALIYVPSYDTSKGTNFGEMFRGCTALTTIPPLNTSLGTNFSSMFNECSALTSVPKLDTSNATNLNYMFGNCINLRSIPELNAQNVTNIQSVYYYCSRLVDSGGFKNLGQAYLTTQAANYSYYTLSLSSCGNLTHESLMNVINNLYDIATKGCNAQKLVLSSTSLTKLTAEEIAIATNKGWTVS